MEIQTMAFQENGSGGCAKQIHLDLTLNEVQNNLAEPLQSMNLERLLENVFPQEVNQSALEDLEISRFVSKNTVDEEWRESQKQKKGDREPQRQVSLGEMTLEDFLVNARVEVDGSDKISHSTRESHWLQQQTQQCMMGSYVPSRSVTLPTDIGANNAILDAVYPDGQVNISSPLSYGPKRVAGEEMTEKALERRKKRMIKNRESAARSRIRKQHCVLRNMSWNEQAYTSELENIILRLEEENDRLRKEKVDAPRFVLFAGVGYIATLCPSTRTKAAAPQINFSPFLTVALHTRHESVSIIAILLPGINLMSNIMSHVAFIKLILIQ
ncbi:hypothetical protein M5K25_019769 [Dendrobium thyrsiflorum]|uniref:BZIP domain-containing protein n=1 Tax=Dendrobium thyrsiflorum TaxID=117978 RepID=A0ABD0UGJ3_DENTH